MRALASAGVITVASAVTVALFTFRIALATRGRRLFAASTAGVEAILFGLILTGLVANLGDPLRLGAYAVGVAAGTLLGLAADERLSSGQSEVRLVVPGDGLAIVGQLHAAGWPATATPALGPSGRTTSVFVAVDDRRVDDLLRLVERLEPAPFVAVGQLRRTRPVPVPAGFAQVGDRGRYRAAAHGVTSDHPAGGHPAQRPASAVAAEGTPAQPTIRAADALRGRPAVSEPAEPDREVAIRDLRLASLELGEALAASEDPHPAVASAIAAWLTAVAARSGHDLRGLSTNPVVLARAHAAVSGMLRTVPDLPDTPALAARARGLADVLHRGLPGGAS